MGIAVFLHIIVIGRYPLVLQMRVLGFSFQEQEQVIKLHPVVARLGEFTVFARNNVLDRY